MKTSTQIVSEANQYRRVLSTDDQGTLTLQGLPFGAYQIQNSPPVLPKHIDPSVLVRRIPTDDVIQLRVAGAKESVMVTTANTLINPNRAGSVNHIGLEFIQNRVSSMPGRSIQDLLSQPGWL